MNEEWKVFSSFANEHPQYAGLTRQLFDEVYEMVVSRCFGWSLPGTMIIPFADCLNHHNSDTQFELFNKVFHMKDPQDMTGDEKENVEGYQTKAKMVLDFSSFDREDPEPL